MGRSVGNPDSVRHRGELDGRTQGHRGVAEFDHPLTDCLGDRQCGIERRQFSERAKPEIVEELAGGGKKRRTRVASSNSAAAARGVLRTATCLIHC
jgi:hypothetical protein